MYTVVGIRFRDSGKVYFFDPRGLELQSGELVVVETTRGLELGRVAHQQRQIEEHELIGDLKPVIRRPTLTDLERINLLGSRQEEVLHVGMERVLDHGLPMRMLKAEYNFDGSRLTFYFTSEQRVDFRQLVRDLARTFRTRIELRQIGPRDEARLLGGVGPCGRALCCATFLPDFARVSIKMAKDQDLPLNPSKISGVCGRLLCCLSYEHEQYLEIKAELPPRGAWVQTPEGPGEVVAVNVARESVTVDVSGNYVDVTLEQMAAATTMVASTARERVASGTAAPATRPAEQELEPLDAPITPIELPRRDQQHPSKRGPGRERRQQPEHALPRQQPRKEQEQREEQQPKHDQQQPRRRRRRGGGQSVGAPGGQQAPQQPGERPQRPPAAEQRQQPTQKPDGEQRPRRRRRR